MWKCDFGTMYLSRLRFLHVSFGFVIILAIAVCKSTLFIRLMFLGSFFSILFNFFSLYWFFKVIRCFSNRYSTHSCLLLTFKQFVMVPSGFLFCVMFSTLVVQIPEPVQYMVLFFGWRVFGDTVPIVFAWFNATYSIPGFCSLVIKSPRSTIKCLNWSVSSKPASKPWNLWMVVAQAGTRGQCVTLQHDCFLLQILVIMGMGMCCSHCGNFASSRE